MLRSMIFNCHCTHPHPIVWGGVGWDDNVIGIATWSWCYALWSSLAIPHDLDATLYDLHWQFHMILMLRSMIFNCHCTHPHPIVWGGVGWDDNVIGIATWSWCYALWSSLAIPHDLDATLYDLHWQFTMILMLRSMIFNCCHCTHPHPIVWGGVGWDDNVIGIATWSWCYALWSSLAFPHDLDATLYDLHWQFHMILMLRSMIFNCHCTHPHPIVWGGVGWDDNVIGIATWSWCYALWSSLAIPHDLDATLYDLHWQFHMILMLRSMIFNCHCTHPHRKRARHAILKYGNACVLSSGGGSAQVKTWWKPPLTRWRKFEKKLRLLFFRLKSWKGCYSQSRWTFFLERFSMKKNAPRCDEILIFIIFVGRQRFRRDVYVPPLCSHNV